MSNVPLNTEGPGWLLLVDPESSGERLDCFVARRLPRVSRSRVARLHIYSSNDQGLLSGTPLKKSTRVREGQYFWVKRPIPAEEITVLEEPQILSRDHCLLMLDKPAGWVAHPTATRYQSALTTWLTDQGISMNPAHRLDAETSGLTLCVAPGSSEMYVRKQFLKRLVSKRYLAICEVTELGRHHLDQHGEQWLDETPLGFDQQSEVKLKMGRGTLDAITKMKVIQWSNHRHRVLIEACPITGRQHQIRVHLSLCGLPIVGDKLYGPSEKFFLLYLNGKLDAKDWISLGHHRQALHATSLSLNWYGEHKIWQSPLPQDLVPLLQEIPR